MGALKQVQRKVHTPHVLWNKAYLVIVESSSPWRSGSDFNLLLGIPLSVRHA